jgi:hypothetical protein
MKYLILPNGERMEWKELRRIRREQILAERRPNNSPSLNSKTTCAQSLREV